MNLNYEHAQFAGTLKSLVDKIMDGQISHPGKVNAILNLVKNMSRIHYNVRLIGNLEDHFTPARYRNKEEK